jgi:DsbC/DsbD-like thiol-disulfide interchange protein
LTPAGRPEPVKLRFVPADAAKPGAVVEIKVDMEVTHGWHTFSDKPEVPGIIATQLILDPSEAFTVERIDYPKPVAVYSDVFKKNLNFIEGQASITVALKLSEKAAGEVPVKGLLKFQACSDTLCLPPAKLPITGAQKVTP